MYFKTFKNYINKCVLIKDQTEFIYFKDSQKVMVRSTETKESAPFIMEDLDSFRSFVQAIIATEPLYYHCDEVDSDADYS